MFLKPVLKGCIVLIDVLMLSSVVLLFFLIFAALSHAEEPKKCSMVCVETVRKKVTTCSSKTGSTLLGAGVGFLIGGPVGGLIGAGAGASGRSKCTESVEEECIRKEERCHE